MTSPLYFDQVTVQGVRNLKPAEFRFCPAVNVFVGDNGQGKTSLLEALGIVATGRSFRTDQLREVVTEHDRALGVSARIVQDSVARHQKLTLSGPTRQGFVDGKRIARLAEYASLTPIVVFHPSDLELVTGTATARRNLLARISLYSDSTSQDTRLAYARAVKHRQVTLEKSPSDDKSLIAFEALIAEHGLRLARSNRQAATVLQAELHRAFSELCGQTLQLETQYDGVQIEDLQSYRKLLLEARSIDRIRGRASFGPHRDDLSLMLAGRTARHHASQGQQRLLALAIKLAELGCITQVRDVHPILLLDDVVSELDRGRTTGVFDWLRASASQIFITAPRDDILGSSAFPSKERLVFTVHQGDLSNCL